MHRNRSFAALTFLAAMFLAACDSAPVASSCRMILTVAPDGGDELRESALEEAVAQLQGVHGVRELNRQGDQLHFIAPCHSLHDTAPVLSVSYGVTAQAIEG